MSRHWWKIFAVLILSGLHFGQLRMLDVLADHPDALRHFVNRFEGLMGELVEQLTPNEALGNLVSRPAPRTSDPRYSRVSSDSVSSVRSGAWR